MYENRNGPDSIIVYHETGKHKKVCEYGHKHMMPEYITKRIYKTNKTHIHDTGYYQVELPLYIDYQGRHYTTYEMFDSGRWSWRRDDDTAWSKDVPRGW